MTQTKNFVNSVILKLDNRSCFVVVACVAFTRTYRWVSPYSVQLCVFMATALSAIQRVSILKPKSFTAHPPRVLELCRGAGLAN